MCYQLVSEQICNILHLTAIWLETNWWERLRVSNVRKYMHKKTKVFFRLFIGGNMLDKELRHERMIRKFSFITQWKFIYKQTLKKAISIDIKKKSTQRFMNCSKHFWFIVRKPENLPLCMINTITLKRNI